MKNWSLRTKLVAMMLGLGILPMLVSNGIAYFRAEDEITLQAKERARMIAEDKAHSIQRYFQLEFSSIIDMTESTYVRQALVELEPKMNDLVKRSRSIEEAKKDVSDFYEKEFNKIYREKNTNQTLKVSSLVASLDDVALWAQYDFIVKNQHPIGEKDKLFLSETTTQYSQYHADVHDDFSEYLKRHKLYDFFLIAPSGRIVYSVFKETDFGLNLLRSHLSDSGITRAFIASKTLKRGEYHVEDFDIYLPSYDAPASFVAAPVFQGANYVGSIVVQLPIEEILAIASSRDGLGEVGQSYIVGADKRLRSNAFRQKEIYNIEASYRKENPMLIMTEEISEVFSSQKSILLEKTSYDGIEVLAFVGPLKIGNINWVIVTELGASEVYAGLMSLRYWLWSLIALSAVLTGFVAWRFGSSIAKRLQDIINKLSESSRQVSGASTESAASSTELSEAATEQAASLQETMASIEEISAMVNQNADSAKKAKLTVEDNSKASNEGAKNVDQMITAISEIKKTNDEILGQMESGNKEFGAIVKIISEIGEKTKVINDIVFQTKLLSFNASVEAARAGEHGKGFAVVAEEVGNLAQMSGNAAKEISGMLAESIKRVNDIVEQTTAKVDQLVEVGKDKVAMGQSVAEKCREALQKIAANASTVSEMVSEIAHASQEQSQGVQEINKAISQLDQVTQQNSAVAQQSSSQAENLSREAQFLNQSVEELVSFVSGASEFQLQNFSPKELKAHLKDSLIVDVRHSDEFSEFKLIPEAKNICLGGDLDAWLKNNHKTLPHKKIVFVCRSGARSMQACMRAKEFGYQHVINLKGGMTAWDEDESNAQSGSNILSLNAKTKLAKANTVSSSAVTKKAVGYDVVPANEDSGFEEF